MLPVAQHALLVLLQQLLEGGVLMSVHTLLLPLLRRLLHSIVLAALRMLLRHLLMTV